MSFGLDARKQQAKFRAESATISEQGRTPTDTKGKNHGHLLALGHEEENLIPSIRGEEGARRCFSERGISWWRDTLRSGDTKGLIGPTRNMASSQIACLNFLLPLASEPAALTSMLHSLDKDVVSVVDMNHRGLRSYVEFEWIGFDATIEEGSYTRGANATSADALLVAETPSGRRAYLMEWKYVEQYKLNDSKAEGDRGKTRISRYQPLYKSVTSPFRQDVAMEEWLYEPFYQILRLLLLGDKMVRNREFEVKQAKLVVVCPRENRDYRERITSPSLSSRYPHLTSVEEVVHAGLKQPEMFASTSCAELIAALRRDLGNRLIDWSAYHEARYGW